jgi:hypothetical protein
VRASAGNGEFLITIQKAFVYKMMIFIVDFFARLIGRIFVRVFKNSKILI